MEYTLYQFKIFSIFSVIVVSLIGGFLPLKIHDVEDRRRTIIMETSRYFTAGIFLGVGLLHMLPEAAEDFQNLGLETLPGGLNFPLAYGICSLGVVILWFIERHFTIGRNRQQMVAAVAGAEHSGGGSICYVDVEPAVSYGPVSCNGQEQDLAQSESVKLIPNVPPLVSEIVQQPPINHHAHSRCSDSEFDSSRSSGHLKSKSKAPQFLANFLEHNNDDDKQALLNSNGQHRSILHSKCQQLHNDDLCLGCFHESKEGYDKERTHDRKTRNYAPTENDEFSAQLNPLSPKKHSHKWGIWSGVDGGSYKDECSALHRHVHISQHKHIVMHGGGALSFFLAALFSLHSFIVGAALGSETTLSGTIGLFIALIAHKGAEAFAVGIQFVREGIVVSKMVGVMSLYCTMTPLGIIIGMASLLIQGITGSIITSSMQAFGAGTVIYIVMHLLNEETSQDIVNKWIQLFFILLGLIIMAAVSIFI